MNWHLMLPAQLASLTSQPPCRLRPAIPTALRSIEPHLQLEKLYVLGTNCVDNGPRQVG